MKGNWETKKLPEEPSKFFYRTHAMVTSDRQADFLTKEFTGELRTKVTLIHVALLNLLISFV
jgi:hypothetical protein